MNHSTIHSRALLVSLSISYWKGRRFDRKVTDEVHAKHGANSDAGRYTKNLLGGSQSKLEAVALAANRMRHFHYANTLPWDREGEQLLPSANYIAYNEGMRELREQFETAKGEFLEAWPEIYADAQKRLNGLFKSADYPTQRQLKGKFGVNIEFAPVPSASDFRLSLPADELLRVEHTVTERVQAATDRAMRDVWDRLYAEVSKIHGNIKRSLETPEEGKRAYNLRESMGKSARELIDLLGRLNVTGSKDLDDMRAQVQKDLAQLDIEQLNGNDIARVSAAARAKEIMDKMRDLYGGPQEVESD